MHAELVGIDEDMIRLKDIAEKAQVSINTVSKALRDAPDISQNTKSRIRRLADELGYMPDGVARGLKNRTTKLLGLVISTTTDPVFSRMVMAIEEKAHELGYDLVLAHSLNIPEREDTVLRRLMGRRVDGLMVSPVYRLESNPTVYEEIFKEGIPTVILGHTAPFCGDFVNVETDDASASFAATAHLVEMGHKQIAFLSGPPAAPHARSRLEGYRRAIREAAMPEDDQLIFKAGSTIEEGEKAALQMLNEKCPATALHAMNDLVAIGAANVFLSQGLSIPRDMSIVGFGNVLISEHFKIPLTTIRQPKLRLGFEAMELMRSLLKGEKPKSRRLHAELIHRKSTGPPRSTA